MDLTGLAVHATTSNAIPQALLPYLAAGRPLEIAVLVWYGIRAVLFIVAYVMAICTKDDKRREAYLQLAQIAARGWPWLPRLPRNPQGG